MKKKSGNHKIDEMFQKQAKRKIEIPKIKRQVYEF